MLNVLFGVLRYGIRRIEVSGVGWSIGLGEMGG